MAAGPSAPGHSPPYTAERGHITALARWPSIPLLHGRLGWFPPVCSPLALVQVHAMIPLLLLEPRLPSSDPPGLSRFSPPIPLRTRVHSYCLKCFMPPSAIATPIACCQLLGQGLTAPLAAGHILSSAHPPARPAPHVPGSDPTCLIVSIYSTAMPSALQCPAADLLPCPVNLQMLLAMHKWSTHVSPRHVCTFAS